jgi:hypothetical protein
VIVDGATIIILFFSSPPQTQKIEKINFLFQFYTRTHTHTHTRSFSNLVTKNGVYIYGANSHLWSVSKFLFDFLGPNYSLFKGKIEPDFWPMTINGQVLNYQQPKMVSLSFD